MHGLFKQSLHEPCKTLQGLSKMVLANVIAFWRYCTILFPCKSLCLQITTEMSKIKKSVRVDMRKGFMLIRATNWQLPFLYQLGPIQKTKQIKTKKHSGTLFKHYFHENKVLHTLTFYIKINHFNIFFHTTWDKWQSFLPV